jgi:hypothetical protein
MKPSSVEPIADDIARLIASERIMVEQPVEFRQRALLRARAARAEHSLRRPATFGITKWRWLAVAAALAVATLAAAVESRRHSAALAPAAPASALTASQIGPGQATHSEAERPESARPADESSDAPSVASAAPPVHPILTRAQGYALELKLLQPARAALNRGDFSSTLAAIAVHAQRFPDGQLSEEREGLRVFALLGAQRVSDARRAAAAFRRRFPRSMLLSRMNAAFGEAQ